MVEVTDLQLKYKLTSSMAKALLLLLTNKVVTPLMLERDLHSISPGSKNEAPITSDSKVLMHRIRRRMDEVEIHIQSQRGLGYWIDQETRDRITSHVNGDQLSLPFDHEGKGDPVAA